jgi:hypothetical protein
MDGGGGSQETAAQTPGGLAQEVSGGYHGRTH